MSTGENVTCKYALQNVADIHDGKKFPENLIKFARSMAWDALGHIWVLKMTSGYVQHLCKVKLSFF